MDLIVAKGVALALFFLIPMVMGSLPLYLRNKLKSRKDIVDIFSYLSCFAGGFFLGTCFLVVLGQGLAKLEEYRHLVQLQNHFPFFEVSIGVGFFLVALIEKIIHLTCAAWQKSHSSEAKIKDEELIRIYKKSPNFNTLTEFDRDLYEDVGVPSKGDGGSSREPSRLERNPGSSSPIRKHEQHGDDDNVDAGKAGGRPVAPCSFGKGETKHGAECLDSGRSGESAERETEVNGSRESGFSFVRVLLLLLALSLHTIFDGLALGLQTEVKDVTALLVALAIHKSIMAAVLGMELMTVFDSLWRPLLVLFLFSLMSPLGVAIGIGVTSGHVHKPAELLTAVVLQAMATGVFVYVTCFEILERDMVARNDRAVLRVLIAIFGFSAIAIIETALAA